MINTTIYIFKRTNSFKLNKIICSAVRNFALNKFAKNDLKRLKIIYS